MESKAQVWRRLAESADEMFGTPDLVEQYRFQGEKVQWNQYINGGLVSLINDVILASPRWMGRGGKAAFTAHALYLALRVEVALMEDPPEHVVQEMERMHADQKSAFIFDQIKRDTNTLKELDLCWRDAAHDRLPTLMESARHIAMNGMLDSHRQRAEDMLVDMQRKLR